MEHTDSVLHHVTSVETHKLRTNPVHFFQQFRNKIFVRAVLQLVLLSDIGAQYNVIAAQAVALDFHALGPTA